VARRADRVERVALDKGLIHMRAGHADKALALLVIVSRTLDRLQVTS
jgi:hypothetical protein